MKQEFTEKFKEVINFVDQSDLSSPNKPAKPHVKRVGEFLYKKGFSDEVVIAGLLHDMLEWSSVTETKLQEKFGARVLELVKANTKNRLLTNEQMDARRRDTVRRCLLIGDGAMAIKIADVLDGYQHYLSLDNEKELERLRVYARLLRENLSNDLKKIFLKDLEKILL